MQVPQIIWEVLINFGVPVTMAEKKSAPDKTLSPEAERALAEARLRRTTAEAETGNGATEHGGPRGAEPTRFGDWERKGIAYDF